MRGLVLTLLGWAAMLLAAGCTASLDPGSSTERVDRTSQALGSSPDGTPCTSASDCTSGYCYPGPDQRYCMAESSNCAQPATSGVLYGATYGYQGVTYACVYGVGLEAPPYGDGAPCTSAGECSSGYCYPGPDQSYCIAASANCAQPGTTGAEYGSSYTYQGVTYTCVYGIGLEAPPYGNGAPCTSDSECSSGYCYPGPDQRYCIAASANCAQPGTAGAEYGSSYTYQGVTYTCVYGVGLEAPPYGNGAPCTSDGECASTYCYPGPDQSYCIAATANCAQPGTSGTQYGSSYTYEGTTYACVYGIGLEAPPYGDGAPCTSDSECASTYCYPGPDQSYCIAATANCAQPGTGGIQYGTMYAYNGVTFACVYGTGLESPPYGNGAQCRSDSECGSGYCYPGPDQSYCIVGTANCAEPGTAGVQYGQGYAYAGATYSCVEGVGLETCTSQSCAQLGYGCMATDNCGLPINCGSCISPQSCGGGGHPGVCGVGGETDGGVGDGGPSLPSTLASGEATPFYGIAVDTVNVYWTSGGNSASGQVSSCAIGGCNNNPTILATGQVAPQGLAVDSKNVYWANSGSSPGGAAGGIMTCPLAGCGGTPTTLVSGYGFSLVVTDGINVYWIANPTWNGTGWTNAMIQSCAVDGCTGSPTTLFSQSASMSGLAIDAHNVYWTTPSAVLSCAVAGCGGAPTTLAAETFAPADLATIVSDGSNVYWSNYSAGTVKQCAAGGCGGTPTLLGSELNFPTALGVDMTEVYWESVGAGTLARCSIGGCGGVPVTVVSGQQSPALLALNATSIYWTAQDLPPATTGSILEMAKPAECTLGQTECSDTGLRTCSVNGQWGATTACAEGCCNGSCTSESTDPNNCGSCSHSCQGGACAGGTCQAVTLATAASSFPAGIAVDATNVYWTEEVGGQVNAVALDGGTPTTIAQSANLPVNLVEGAGSLYWTDDNTVETAPLSGGSPNIIFSGQPGQSAPEGIAFAAGYVYFVDYDTGLIMKVGDTGGTAVTIASGQTEPIAIALDSNYVYWTNLNPGAVMRAPLAGGSSATALVSSGVFGPAGIAIDATSVYYANGGSEIRKVPLGGGSTTLLASGFSGATAIATDGANVYWLNNLAQSGSVMKVPVGGGSVTTLASNQDSPWALAIDGTCVYWVNRGSGTVMKVVKQ